MRLASFFSAAALHAANSESFFSRLFFVCRSRPIRLRSATTSASLIEVAACGRHNATTFVSKQEALRGHVRR